MQDSRLFESGIIGAEHAESTFKSYNLDDRSMELGYRLTAENEMVIQNLICTYAHEHLQIKYDPAIPHEAALIQARLYGMIESLQYLLDANNALKMQDEADRNSQQ